MTTIIVGLVIFIVVLGMIISFLDDKATKNMSRTEYNIIKEIGKQFLR